ncbi:trypsin-like serine peptidase [Nonomuraea dietziae]|uniref:trypsin-like serine peptidase n=1 Tax=Nonomuraea dietziae TaxID=65515 RepID=UPI0033E8A5F3
MKRILIPASGAVLATGLLAAGLAGTAQATSDVASDPMAKNAAVAQSIAQYWAESNGAALRAATESNIWDSKDVAKLKSTGGYSADTKPGVVAPIGEEKKTATKSQNVNMPKTIGKVFFVNSKGERKWCSATSIQSRYRNLVSTAGHCVYDTAGNADTMSKWVFVPGYYQGKAPFGIYVGKQAFTHYDFDVYEDFDRDYAFVTVYNGIKIDASKASQVTKSEFEKHVGPKWVDEKTITRDEWVAGVEKYGVNGPFQSKAVDPKVETVAKPADAAQHIEDYILGKGPTAGVQLTGVEVVKSVYTNAGKGLDNGNQFERLSTKLPISAEEYAELNKAKADGKFLGELTVDLDNNKQPKAWYKQQFFIKKWIKTSEQFRYWVETYYVQDVKAADAGRLGDAVGGQGFAYNQPTGKYVRVFGYPAAAHPDGHKNFTGITPKWCYGKTTAKTVGSAAKKIEEHIALKCSMTEGADGGPWLLKYSNAKRLGYVNGVTSTFNDQDGNDRVDYISSPYFDGETNTVYKAAANVWSGKIVG